MLLQHPAVKYITEFIDIIDVLTFKDFIKKLNKAASSHDPDLIDPLHFKGDMFEAFVEYFFKFFNGDHTLTYVADYEPNNEYDCGIDGRGRSTYGGDAVVQIKFSSNPSKLLTNEQNISNVVAAAVGEGLMPDFKRKNIILITSAKGVHRNHAMAPVHCINYDQIARRVDKNEIFWSDFKYVVKDTLAAH